MLNIKTKTSQNSPEQSRQYYFTELNKEVRTDSTSTDELIFQMRYT
jgi:hypothetical protein